MDFSLLSHFVRSNFWNIIIGLVVGFLIAYIGGLLSPALVLALILGLGFAVLVFIYPEFGLLVTIALVPIERFGRFTDDTSEMSISLMRIMGIIVLGVVIVYKLVYKKQFIFGKPFFIYLSYLFLVIISLSYTTDSVGTTRAIGSYLANLMFFFMVINLIKSKKIILLAIMIWLSVSVAIGVYSIYDWYLGSGASESTYLGGKLDPGKGAQTTEQRWSTIWIDTSESQTLGGKSLRRTMGSTSHSAVYGINLVLTIPFFFFLLKLPLRRLFKVIVFVSLGVILYNVLLTNTRATIILAIGVIGLCFYRGLGKINIRLAVVAVILLPVVLLFMPVDIHNRILDMQNYSFEKSESLRIREKYFFAGMNAFSEHWLLGQGAENEQIIPQYLDSWVEAPSHTTVHNQYLQTLIELGLIGFFLQYGFVLLLLYYCTKALNTFKNISELKQEYYLMLAIQISMIATLLYAVQVEVFQFPLKGWWFISALTVVLYHYSLQYKKEVINKDE